MAGGFPVVPRRGFRRPLDDVVLRAYLNQPLLLFGHQNDVADGLGFLERAAFAHQRPRRGPLVVRR